MRPSCDRLFVVKEMWRADYVDSVSAGPRTAIFRMNAEIGEDGGRNSSGRPLWVRVQDTSAARELCQKLLEWADSRDELLSRLPRSHCSACDRAVWLDQGLWRDAFTNDTCRQDGERRPHCLPADAPREPAKRPTLR